MMVTWISFNLYLILPTSAHIFPTSIVYFLWHIPRTLCSKPKNPSLGRIYFSPYIFLTVLYFERYNFINYGTHIFLHSFIYIFILSYSIQGMFILRYICIYTLSLAISFISKISIYLSLSQKGSNPLSGFFSCFLY